jgi:hypothetical protein
MRRIFNELDTVEKLTALLGFISMAIFGINEWFIQLSVDGLLELTFHAYILICILLLNKKSKKDNDE